MQREPLREDIYWKKWLLFTDDNVKKRETKLLTVPFPENWKRNIITQNLYYDRKNLIYFQYSAGEPLELIKPNIPKLMQAWQDYNVNISTGDNNQHLQDFTDYQRVLTLISFAILFGEGKDAFQKIASHIHSNGEDGLIEMLLSSQLQGRTQADELIYRKTFDLLFRAIKATGKDQVELIKKYLSKWYANMKGVKGRGMYGYEAHKSKGEGGFMGYWSFEAAAVVALYNIDDSSFRDMDFYPKDIADYGKQIKNSKNIL